MDDVKTLLREEGYRLEDAFVKDLVRLVNGDLNVLSYTLAYYKEEGFINPDGALNDVIVKEDLHRNEHLRDSEGCTAENLLLAMLKSHDFSNFTSPLNTIL